MGAAPTVKDKAVHLVFGGDEYQVATKARRIVDQLCPPSEQALGLEIIDGQADNSGEAVAVIKRVLEAVCTIGFLGAGKVTWLRGADFFAETQTGKAADVKSRVEGLVKELKAGLPAGNFLVISAGKVSKRSSFYKTCKDVAALYEYEAPESDYKLERHAQGIARKALSKMGVEVDEYALDCFLARAGTDTRQIVQEAQKLSLYVGDAGRATRADVEAVVSPSREAVMWSLADAVAGKKLKSALSIVRQLFAQKEQAMGMIMTIEKRFRLLMWLKASMDRGWVRITGSQRYQQAEWGSDPEMEAYFGNLGRDDPRKMHPYRTLLLCRQAGAYSLTELAAINQRILRTHELIVSNPVPPQILLEVLISEIAGNKPVTSHA